LAEAYDSYEQEVRDLPCFEFRTTVVVELYRVRCPDCGVKSEKVPSSDGCETQGAIEGCGNDCAEKSGVTGGAGLTFHTVT